MNFIKRHKWLLGGLLTIVTVVAVLGVQVNYKPQIREFTVTVGTIAEASGTVDYICDGIDDDIQLQGALDALPPNGGSIRILAGNYDFANATTVTRVLDNVTIIGTGRGTYITCDGATAIFTAGGNNWTIRDLRTDAGGLAMGTTTGWSWENVTINATYYAYRTDDATTASSWNIPTGRGSMVFIAASNATAVELSQADVWCDGVNDETQLNTALTMGKKVLLSSGKFHLDGNVTPVSQSTLLGLGINQTEIELDDACILIDDKDDVELGGFTLSGLSSATYKAGIEIQNSANHHGYYIHDIICTAIGHTANEQISDFYIYNNSTAAAHTLSKVVFERCSAISPDGFGFALHGEGATIPITGVKFLDCYVYNAGVAVTRKEDAGVCWVTGFDFAEAAGIVLTDCEVTRCTVDGAWESGFHIESAPTVVNFKMTDCTSKNSGQKVGDPGTAIYGAGFLLGVGQVTLTNCSDYGSYRNMHILGAGNTNIEAHNFRGFDSVAVGVYMDTLTAGDKVKLIGGGCYSAGNYAVSIINSHATSIVLDGFDVIDPATNFTLANLLNSDNITWRNSFIKVGGANVALYATDADNLRLEGLRIPDANYPISIDDANVVLPVIINNNWYGCNNEPVTTSSTTPRIADNINKTGAWAFGDNVQ